MSKDLRRKHIRRRIQEPLQEEQDLRKLFHAFAGKTDSLGIPLLREVLLFYIFFFSVADPELLLSYLSSNSVSHSPNIPDLTIKIV
jgi:hypothetical protein